MEKHHRQSIRLKGWDYTQAGAYFITICTHQRECLFEQAAFRVLAENGWQNIPSHPHAVRVHLDEWVVMPNHLHGILMLFDNDNGGGRGEASRIDGCFANNLCSDLPHPYDGYADWPHPYDGYAGPPCPSLKPGSIGAIVGNFKSLTARRINNLRRTLGSKVWQRGYYDRIIRNERELEAVRLYIQNNPQRWAEDRENLDKLLLKMDYHP